MPNFARRKLRKQLSGYLDPESVQELLDGRGLGTSRIQSGRFDFIFAFVRGKNLEQLAERIGFVADTGIEHGAVIHSLVGPMVVMAFGTLGAAQHSPTSRGELLSHMQAHIASDIKIVHGTVDGHFGNFGGKTRLSYTFTFPRFDTALATMGRLEFGQTEELVNDA